MGLYSNHFRIPKWYKITEKDVDNVWTPDVMFLNAVETETVKFWGKAQSTYDFWLQTRHDKFNLNYKAVLLTFKKAMKVTFTCDFDFGHYPYDFHECNFDFGIPGVYINDTVIMAPIKILNGTQAVLLDYEKSIPSDHLPYSFTITRKDQFPVPEYEYLAPFVGVIIKFKRNDLGV